MTAFWDASAVLHLCVPGQASSRARRVFRSATPVVWWVTQVEVRSALARLQREGSISDAAYAASRQRLSAMLGAWKEILPVESVRECALEQLGRFPLRAADALQLAAAIIWSGRNPRGRRFVSNDLQLGSAAREAGFDVLTT